MRLSTYKRFPSTEVDYRADICPSDAERNRQQTDIDKNKSVVEAEGSSGLFYLNHLLK